MAKSNRKATPLLTDLLDHLADRKNKDCPNCEGTGWTEEGWNKAQIDSGFDVKNPFAGNCKSCGGTGLLSKI